VLLSRNRVISAAMELIEAEGVESVSMHRLATDLGCGLIALYSHVPSMAALLDCVAATVAAGIELPAEPGGDWAGQLRAQARAVRKAARAHPRCALLAGGRPPTSASALRPVEAALATLRDAGFCGRDGAAIIRTLGAYLLGSLLREASMTPGTQTCSDAPRPRLRRAEFPLVTAVMTELAEADPDADFEFGLDLLLGGLAALRPSRADG
jgi:AcrR family transcriptional regulator